MKNNNANVNATINNASVNNKEENNMNIAMTIEELKNMKRDELRVAAQTVGIKGYSKMKKDDLVQALVPFCKPELKIEETKAEEEKDANGFSMTAKKAIVDYMFGEQEDDAQYEKMFNTLKDIQVIGDRVIVPTKRVNARRTDGTWIKNGKVKCHEFTLEEGIWVGSAAYDTLVPFCKSELKVEVVEVETAASMVPPVGQYPINPLDDPEVMALDVSDEALLQPVVETVNVVENKEETTMNNNLITSIAKKIIFQTIPNKNGQLIIKNGEDGKLELIKGTALFYRPNKKANPTTEYMVLGSRLWGVVSSVVGEVEGEDKKTFDRIQQTIDDMVKLDMITKISESRTFVTLTPTDMSQDEKDQLNGLWRTKDIKTEKTKDGKVKVTAVTDNGKEVINQLYPCYSYGATVVQMNKIYALSK